MKKQSRRERKYKETGFERWGGYMSAKLSKLQNQYKQEAGDEEKGIFSGIAVFVNGYTNPTAEEIKRIMIMHGGTYHHYYSKTRTSHVIASNLPNSKIQSHNTDFIVSPKWIVDSVESKKLLDYKKYLLYTSQKQSQPRINFQNLPLQNIDFKTSGNSMDKISKSPEQSGRHPALSTANPNFLSEFYNNSRLHHIATARTMFKDYVRDLQTKEDNFYGRVHLIDWMESNGLKRFSESSFSDFKKSKHIMHIDMDCFFVSVGLLTHPDLRDKPVAVTHASRNSQPRRCSEDFEKEVNHFKRRFDVESTNYCGSENEDEASDSNETVRQTTTAVSAIDNKCSMSEIACCSYEARKVGVRNGMFLGVALKLCPDLKTIPYDFDGYKRVSLNLYDILATYTKNIEAVSCDEMYVDLDDVLNECDASPADFAACIREQIHEKTKCPCSVGIAPNMLVARMATKRAKPNGTFIVAEGDVLPFMETQMVSDLPGVGRTLQQRLESENIMTCMDIRTLSLQHLQSSFGQQTGKALYDSCRGVDDRSLNTQAKRKSVSAEVNYGIRFESWPDCEKFFHDLSAEVESRLTKLSLKGRTITLKLKIRAKEAPVETAKFMGHGICDNVAKSITFNRATDSKDRIYMECIGLLRQTSIHPKELRGIGIQVTKLESLSTERSLSIRKYFSNVKNNCSEESNNDNEEKDRLEIADGFNSSKITVSEKGRESSVESSSNGFKEQLDSPSDSIDADYFRYVKNIADNFSTPTQNFPKTSNYEIKPLKHTSLNPCEDLSEPLPNQSPVKDFEITTTDSSGSSFKNRLHTPSKALDLDVLNALSPDLRAQVVKEYESQGFYIPSENKVSSSSQPGPSNASTFIPDFKNLANKEEADISISQIDASILNSLPEDILEELEKDSESRKLAGKISRNQNCIRPVSYPPPTKRKRGRPPGTTSRGPGKKKQVTIEPLKSISEEENKPKLSDYLPPIQTYFTDGQLAALTEEVLGKSAEEFDTDVIGENSSPCLSQQIQGFSYSSTLCGEFELPSIKHLLSEWVQSCTSPADVDVQILTTFFVNLIKEKDLEKLELVLKFLYRRIQLTGSTEWKESFELILGNIQNVMLDTYKAPLHLPQANITSYSRSSSPKF